MMSRGSHTLTLRLRRYALVFVSQNVITTYLFEVRKLFFRVNVLKEISVVLTSPYSQLTSYFSIPIPSTRRCSNLLRFVKYFGYSFGFISDPTNAGYMPCLFYLS
jgi:hypothetical protein